MKIYDELTKNEKEKLLTFVVIKNTITIQNLIILLMAVIFSVAGIILIMTFYPPFILTGIILLMGGIMYAIVVSKQTTNDKKRYQLIFGNETIFSDMFDIKQSDLDEMKLRWKKEK